MDLYEFFRDIRDNDSVTDRAVKILVSDFVEKENQKVKRRVLDNITAKKQKDFCGSYLTCEDKTRIAKKTLLYILNVMPFEDLFEFD